MRADGLEITLVTNNMNETINCTNCLRPLLAMNTFTSRTIHTDIGLGFPVCEQCYDEERADEAEAKKKRNTP